MRFCFHKFFLFCALSLPLLYPLENGKLVFLGLRIQPMLDVSSFKQAQDAAVKLEKDEEFLLSNIEPKFYRKFAILITNAGYTLTEPVFAEDNTVDDIAAYLQNSSRQKRKIVLLPHLTEIKFLWAGAWSELRLKKSDEAYGFGGGIIEAETVFFIADSSGKIIRRLKAIGNSKQRVTFAKTGAFYAPEVLAAAEEALSASFVKIQKKF